MKTIFGSLHVGQHFDLGVDADGYEPVYYKLSDSEAYQTHGRGAGSRELFAPDVEVYAGNMVTALHDHVTEIERVAITLLCHYNTQHPGLRQWVLALGENPDERRSLDRYIWDETIAFDDHTEPLRAYLVSEGYVVWRREWDRDHSAFSAILDHKPKGEHETGNEARALLRMDDALLRLADALVEYRVAGRPEGDQTHEILGMGSPIAIVSTSLAAAVVEFHTRVVGVYAGS